MNGRDRVVISGYYGFGNLGDEAILEELLNELKRLVEPENIVVLSQNPEKTTAVFGVGSINRWQLKNIGALFRRTRLFVSGGGGLFQDASSVKSVAYYAALAFLARLRGAPTVIYAQGIGPLRSTAGAAMTRMAIKQASAITVRDSDSKSLLESWGMSPQLTADPVWCLKATDLPVALASQLKAERERLKETQTNGSTKGDGLLIGVSLRESKLIGKEHAEILANAMADAMPNATVLPLILQEEQDRELLDVFCAVWKSRGKPVLNADLKELVRPSQWVSLLSQLDAIVGMRLHALLMALKSGVPTLGIAYDPKVSYLMINFEQPFLNLADGSSELSSATVSNLLQQLLGNIASLSETARRKASEAEVLACQNFEVLDRILKTQGQQ